LFIFGPLVLLFVWSFTDRWPWPNLVPDSASLRGYETVFSPYSDFGVVLVRTLAIAIMTSLLSVLVATLAARALVTHRFWGREVFRFATILPFLIPQTVFAMGVQVLFLRIGLANTVGGVVIAHTILALPYAVAIMVDVTAAVGTRFEEQAKALGANPLKTITRVTIPCLLPGLLSAAAMSYLISIGTYFVTLLVGGGKVSTVMLMMFPFLTSSDRTVASAYAVIFLVASLAVFLIFELILKRLGIGEQKHLFV
jgi:putative spermidine/putrescine transport system permease protein